MNIKKCTNVSGRALHLCKKAHCGRQTDRQRSKQAGTEANAGGQAKKVGRKSGRQTIAFAFFAWS